MNFRKLFVSGILCTAILAGSTTDLYAANLASTTQKGETLKTISQKQGGSVAKKNAAGKSKAYMVQKGDSYWLVSQKFHVNINQLLALNGADKTTHLYTGQQIKVPVVISRSAGAARPSANSSKPSMTYLSYTVKKGDILWNISNEFGVPLSELLKANNLNESSAVDIGDVIKIPVHNVPVKATPGHQYGEALDWWTEAQYVIPMGSDFEVVDFYTGKSFFARRTTGANHADCETLTPEDTNKMKAIWGGSFSWTSRPVLIQFKDRKIAASMSAMPHAGNDSAAAAAWTNWRSGDYGAGENYDWIKNNGIDGHFDIHFLNSTTHKDGTINAKHQENIRTSAGLK